MAYEMAYWGKSEKKTIKNRYKGNKFNSIVFNSELVWVPKSLVMAKD